MKGNVETNNMRRWIKEPLRHFFLPGGLLFSAYAWLNRGGGDEPRVVRITAAEVAWLKESWVKQWLRPPSEQELRDCRDKGKPTFNK